MDGIDARKIFVVIRSKSYENAVLYMFEGFPIELFSLRNYF